MHHLTIWHILIIAVIVPVFIPSPRLAQKGPHMIELLLFLHILLFVFAFTFTAGTAFCWGGWRRPAMPRCIHTTLPAARRYP
jgi:hypothetical protein